MFCGIHLTPHTLTAFSLSTHHGLLGESQGPTRKSSSGFPSPKHAGVMQRSQAPTGQQGQEGPGRYGEGSPQHVLTLDSIARGSFQIGEQGQPG